MKQVYDFNHEEEDEEESEDEVEKVYDKFQLDEDKEISSVVPKREGKNGSHLAMHHKVYPTKNKGKKNLRRLRFLLNSIRKIYGQNHYVGGTKK